MDLAAAAAQIAADITAAGVPAAVDGRDLELPGAWVTIGAIALDYLSRNAYSVTWQIFLISRDLGTPVALEELGSMLSLIADPLKVTEATPTGVTLPSHGADPLPALQITLETRIEETS